LISLFRSYHPALIFFLLLYVALFRVSLFFGEVFFPPPATSNYLSSLVYDGLQLLIGGRNYLYHLIASLLVFFQSLYFNYLVNRYRLLNRPSYVPAMAYVLISSLLVEFTLLTPTIMANTFLLFALSKILSIYKREKAAAAIFDAALLISVSSLFFFPYLAFFLFVLASVIILRPVNLREYLMAALGLLVPYYFIGVYFFWYYDLGSFWKTLEFTRLNFPVEQLERSARVIVISVALALVVLWNLLYIQANMFRMVVQVRAYLTVFMLLFAAGVVSMLMEFSGEFFHFVWMALPVGLAFAIFFQETRRRWIAEMLHFFLLLSVLFFQYYFLIK
jgi:hypothetical protein